MRKYHPAFVEGTTNVHTTAFKEHTAMDMHAHAMLLFRKQCATHLTEYSPIMAALLQPSMDSTTREQLKRKFDITYMIAKENLSFTKMKAICQLEERHGADLGPGYKNDCSCAVFIHFIARDLQNQLMLSLSHSKYFSLQADGITNAQNIKNELFLVLYFDPHAKDGMVHVHDFFLTVRQLSSGTARGLFACLKGAMEHM